MHKNLVVAVSAAAVLALPMLGGCSSSNDATAADSSVPASSASPGSDTTPAAAGEVMVMAAGSLKSALDPATAAFEQANPGVKVTINYGHMPTLFTQLAEAVPADVLVTPDAATMKSAQDKGFVTATPTPVAGNPLALVVPKGNPGAVSDVSALANPDLTVAVCAAELPCGKLTDELAAKAGVKVAADTQEPGGSPGIVTKVAAGEVQVGVVFAPDIKAGGDKVEAIAIDPAVLVVGKVMAAPLTEANNVEAAQAYIAYLASAPGTAAFTTAGFTAP